MIPMNIKTAMIIIETGGGVAKGLVKIGTYPGMDTLKQAASIR